MRARAAVSVVILALLAVGIGVLIHTAAPSGEAMAASEDVSDAVKVIESKVAQNVKMMACPTPTLLWTRIRTPTTLGSMLSTIRRAMTRLSTHLRAPGRLKMI
jgi:hypothetical protein